MTILVLSDSHGNVGNMIRAVEQVQPDRVLHLGDCQRDLTALAGEFPALPMEGVPGNCDWGSCRSGCWRWAACAFSCSTVTPGT